MRQLATLPSADTAQALADYLLTLRIDTKLERQPEGWSVWVCDEDHVARARQELDEFNRNPHDPRYTAASREADALRREKRNVEKVYHRRQERFHSRMREAGTGARWTIALIVVSVLVTLVTQGSRSNSDIAQALSIASYKLVLVAIDSSGEDQARPVWRVDSDGLKQVLHGQVWRLVTPIFLHINGWHLLFDMYMLYVLGSAIERRRGPARYLSLVVALAVISNLVQLYLGHPHWDGTALHLTLTPDFGGMSGVVYGLFGYIWMKARFHPELGLGIQPSAVVYLMAWFFLCMTSWFQQIIGPVANGAHAGGLIAGILIGYLPIVWHSFRSE